VGYKTRRLIIEPVFQTRFAVMLVTIVFISLAIATSVGLGLMIRPSSDALADASRSLTDESISQARLIDIISNPDVPASQRLSLAKAEALQATALIRDTALSIREAADKQSGVSGLILGLALALVFALLAGYAWARRIVGTEIGFMRRLEDMVNGDLSREFSLRKYDELHFLRRGMLKLLDELRSMTKRDQRLIQEVIETVEQMCASVKTEPLLSEEGKSKLELAAAKIKELDRIRARYRY
jgi:methyl-accepting chemotaxis protein